MTPRTNTTETWDDSPSTICGQSSSTLENNTTDTNEVSFWKGRCSLLQDLLLEKELAFEALRNEGMNAHNGQLLPKKVTKEKKQLQDSLDKGNKEREAFKNFLNEDRPDCERLNNDALGLDLSLFWKLFIVAFIFVMFMDYGALKDENRLLQKLEQQLKNNLVQTTTMAYHEAWKKVSENESETLQKGLKKAQDENLALKQSLNAAKIESETLKNNLNKVKEDHKASKKIAKIEFYNLKKQLKKALKKAREDYKFFEDLLTEYNTLKSEWNKAREVNEVFMHYFDFTETELDSFFREARKDHETSRDAKSAQVESDRLKSEKFHLHLLNSDCCFWKSTGTVVSEWGGFIDILSGVSMTKGKKYVWNLRIHQKYDLMRVGVVSALHTTNFGMKSIGSAAGTWGYRSDGYAYADGKKLRNKTIGYSSGSVVMLVLDLSNESGGTLSVKVDNSPSYQLFTGLINVSDTFYPAVYLYDTSDKVEFFGIE